MTPINGRRSTAIATGVALALLGGVPADAASGSAPVNPVPVRLAPELPGNSLFGAAVAVDGDTLVVGAPDDDAPDRDSGSVTVYVADGAGGWAEQARLVPSRPDRDAHFGYSVAVDGDTVLIGAAYEEDGDYYDAGAAYVFVRSGATWTEQARLELATLHDTSHAGWSVGLQGDVAAIGVPDGGSDHAGAVEIFSRAGTTWTPQAVLQDPGIDAGGSFGIAVALDGDTLVVGQADFEEALPAYVFVGSGATWTPQATLLPAEVESDDYFGGAVDVSGDTVVVAAEFDDVDGAQNSGSAYVFTRTQSTWTQQSQVAASQPYEGDRLGFAVTLDRGVLVVGSYNYSGTLPFDVTGGAAYLFRRTTDGWTQRRLLLPPEPGVGGHFGSALDLAPSPSGGRTLVSGAEWERRGGAAYVYQW